MKLKNNLKKSKKNIMKKRIVKKKSLKKMREKKRKTLKLNYINKKGGNNDEIDKDVAYLTVSIIELKALKIIGGVSTKETEIFNTENPLSNNSNNKNVNFNSHNDNQVFLEKYLKARPYYQKAHDIVEQIYNNKDNTNNKDILWQDVLWAIVQANNDMCEAKIIMYKAKSKNPIIIEDLRNVESLYLNALDILIKVLPKDVIGDKNELMIIGKSKKISPELLKTMADCFVLLGDVNKMIGDHFEDNYDEYHKKLEIEKKKYDYNIKNNFEELLKKSLFYIKSPTFDIKPYTNKNQDVQHIVNTDGVKVLENDRIVKKLPVNYVNYYYIISFMYYKNAHEIYFPVLGEKHWHTQVSSFFKMSYLCHKYNNSIEKRFINSYKDGDGAQIYSRKLLSQPTQLPELSFQKEFVNIKIVTGDDKEQQIKAWSLDSTSVYYDKLKWREELHKKLDYKYRTHWPRAKYNPSSYTYSHNVIDSIEKEEEIRFFLNDYMIEFEYIKLNDSQYYERYITNEEEEKMKEIKTINKDLLKINIDDVNIVDAIKKKYGKLLETRKIIKNIHTFKRLETIDEKPPTCGKIQCGPPDIDCNVKCKTQIKVINEKGDITFCTDLQDKGRKKSFIKRTRNNQCTSSNKKIEYNKIGIFHTEGAGNTQKQGDLVVRLRKVITEGDEKGLFEIYLDKSK